MNERQSKADSGGLSVHGFSDRTTGRSILAVAVKEVFERGCCAAGLVVLAVPLALVALAIRLDSPGPIIFVQPRFGKGAKPFGTFKFRTMHSDMTDISGGRQTGESDPRITRVGALLRRTSVDELPQLMNVVLGQMALVGPRAHPCGMRVEGVLCADLVENYHERHRVKPGITGLAQVSGSRGAVENEAALRRRVELDNDYISRWSLGLDLWIIWRTVVDLASGKAAG